VGSWTLPPKLELKGELLSITYVLREEALGMVDRLAFEIREFEISKGLRAPRVLRDGSVSMVGPL
jgi:hypothetical protein